MREIKLVQALDQWESAIVACEAAREARLVAAVAVMRQRTEAMALNVWCEWLAVVVERALKLRVAVGRMQSRQAASAFRSWLELLEAAAARHATILAKAVERMRYGHLARAYGTWVALLETTQRHTAILGRAMKRMRGDMLSLGFDGWVACVDVARLAAEVAALAEHEEEATRSKTQRAVVWMQKGQAVRAFNGWVAAVAWVARQRERLRISLGHFSQNSLYAALQTWSDWTDFKIFSQQKNALAADLMASQ